jgi:hypothetical protein
MKEMIQIDNYIGKVHTKFMKVKKTSSDHSTRDLWFSMNLMQLALGNLKRCSSTFHNSDKVFKDILKECIKGPKYDRHD